MHNNLVQDKKLLKQRFSKCVFRTTEARNNRPTRSRNNCPCHKLDCNKLLQ